MPATPRPLPSLLLLLVGCATISHGTALRFPRFGNPFATSTSCQRPSSNGAEPGAVSITPEGDFVFVPDQHTPHAVAWGSYVDSAHTSSNFGQLRINTSGNYSDADQAFAAGFLEGHLTARRIYQQYANLHTYFTKTLNASLEGPMEWVDKQDRWVRDRCASQDVGIPAPRGRATTASFLDSEDANENLSGANAQGGLESNDHEHHHHKHHHHKHERQSTKGTNERFWKAVCLTVRQFDGVIAGYTSRAALEPNNHLIIPQMKYYDFLFLENNADLYDIIDAEDPSQGPSWNPGGDDDDDTNSTATIADENHDLLSFMDTNDDKHRKRRRPPPAAKPTARDAEALFRKIALSGKCSALVKLAPDLSDLWLGHSTWDSYTAMLRIWKHYSFDFRQLNPPAQRLSFSSYPGEVFSDDDFFLLSSGLAILQTTNKIFNDDLFEGLKHKSVPSWQRIRAANWLASSGEEWTQLLDTENSGTYNNQYIVVDLNKFVPGEELRPGLLWVAEQIPGKVVAADLTSVLAMGYWPSFNVPYFSEIYGASGYPDFIRKLDEYGQHFGRTTHWLSYTNSPRAKIFRRDHPKVTSMADMAAIMRSNDWRNDPLSEGHPICAVCGRGDLDPGFPELRGCYDTKVASWASALRLEAVAVNGPTTMGARAFQWSKVRLSDTDDNGTTAHVPLHLGHPDRFNFQFERMSPREEAVGCGAAPWDDGDKEGGASVF